VASFRKPFKSLYIEPFVSLTFLAQLATKFMKRALGNNWWLADICSGDEFGGKAFDVKILLLFRSSYLRMSSNRFFLLKTI
jgi:hypothetical protein